MKATSLQTTCNRFCICYIAFPPARAVTRGLGGCNDVSNLASPYGRRKARCEMHPIFLEASERPPSTLSKRKQEPRPGQEQVIVSLLCRGEGPLYGARNCSVVRITDTS
jgi:hypothetical protein